MSTDVLELFCVPDTFCEDLARVDQLGPCHRLTFAVRGTVASDGRVVAAKLIVPTEAVMPVIMLRGALVAPEQRSTLLCRAASFAAL